MSKISRAVRGQHEVIIPHAELANPQTITERNEQAFAERDSNIHVHEVTDITDDFDAGVRRMRFKMPRTFVDLGRKSHR